MRRASKKPFGTPILNNLAKQRQNANADFWLFRSLFGERRNKVQECFEELDRRGRVALVLHRPGAVKMSSFAGLCYTPDRRKKLQLFLVVLKGRKLMPSALHAGISQ
jgi:hypothetical protein